MSGVDLGFVENCESWQVESYLFPSKIGGKPAWLDLENLPQPEDLQCEICKKPLIFLCQIYAPYEDDEANFHRTIFVFICKDAKCCQRNNSCNVKVFRSCLPRRNKFYSFEPVEGKLDDFSLDKWVNLCSLCGCLSFKHCSKCKKVAYCSRDHQVIDWKQGHKSECENGQASKRSSLLFPEFEVVIEVEELTRKAIDETEELKKFQRLEIEGKTGTMDDVSGTEIERHAAVDQDKVFSRFKKRISECQDQVLRYERGGEPLWIAEKPKPELIPNCELCGSSRQFEFQVMPQLLSTLKEYGLDWGVILIYTCKSSCTLSSGYKREFIFKQDVAINNL